MGKYNGALCRLCRAEGTKLFLKGKRCLTEKCSLDKRSYPPGQRGSRFRYRKSDYKIQLREKQKVKRFYGIGEKQFRIFFKKASQKKGITGENLLRSLEMRFDNILYRMNFAYSRAHARQIIRHGHLNINGRKVSIPSYQLKLNDVIEFREKSKKNENIKAIIEDVKGLVEIPEWLLVEPEKQSGKVNSIPNRDDVSLDVEEHLVVELYSK
ncbi:MAG: 30S ribosomal protein S4 [Candidatus Aminicenantes bacterium]|nr:30S ribosomal protein S4 [Candidatus Aminicenantes bacterium]